MKELKPCPFCGSNDLVFRNENGNNSLCVRCPDCGMQGPEVTFVSNLDIESHNEAAGLWNNIGVPENQKVDQGAK